MIDPKKEVNRMPGLDPLKVAGVPSPHVVSGRLVRLIDTATLTLANGGLSAASNYPYGVAADDTAQHTSGTYYTITDNYNKGGKVGAFINGGVFDVWNDGRGLVFNADVINAAAGTPLYIGNDGEWTITKGSASTVGELVMGIVLVAPTSASGTLKVKVTGV